MRWLHRASATALTSARSLMACRAGSSLNSSRRPAATSIWLVDYLKRSIEQYSFSVRYTSTKLSHSSAMILPQDSDPRKAFLYQEKQWTMISKQSNRIWRSFKNIFCTSGTASAISTSMRQVLSSASHRNFENAEYDQVEVRDNRHFLRVVHL